jgi:hypothetical protein
MLMKRTVDPRDTARLKVLDEAIAYVTVRAESRAPPPA